MQASQSPTLSAPTPSPAAAGRGRKHPKVTAEDYLGLRLCFHIASRADAEFAVSATQSVLIAFSAPSAPLRTPRATRTKAAANRENLLAYVKAQAVERGIIWVRANVFGKYRVRKPSYLTDAQLGELAAHMKATECAS
jgi:hypothetical protein